MMDSADFIATLAEATFASSVAIGLVLLLRQPLRVRFGASIGYAAWFLVPAALVAVLIPAATVSVPVVYMPSIATAAS